MNKKHFELFCLCKAVGILLFWGITSTWYREVLHQATIFSLILLSMIYWSFQSVLIMYYGKDCPNIGDEWQCWWEWPSLALPLWPEMDAPKTDIKARNIGVKIQSTRNWRGNSPTEWLFISIQYVPAMVSVVHIYCNVTYLAAIRVEIKIRSCNKGAPVGGEMRKSV